MSLADLHAISNDYQNVRLVSLRTWKSASQINPRDNAGPYMVCQSGYDPADATLSPDEFVLGKSGQWLSTATFFQLPVEVRRAEYVFGTAAEVMGLISGLPSKVAVTRPGAEAEATPEADTAGPDDMKSAFLEGQGGAASPSAPKPAA